MLAQEKITSTHHSLSICTLGAAGHGKTTLTAAIQRVVARIGAIHSKSHTEFEQQLPAHYPLKEGVGITYREVDYETSGKFYRQIDCDTHLDIVKMLVSRSFGIQGGIWVVDAFEGVTEESVMQIEIAHRTQLSNIISFLNTHNVSEDDELQDICYQEMRDLITKCGWDEKTNPIIVGDANRALKYKGDRTGAEQWKPIVNLIFALNQNLPDPIKTENLQLIMPIYEIIEELKERVTVRGKVVQGHLSVGQAVDIVGKGDRIKTKCLNTKEDEVVVESEPDWISVGQVICTPKSIKAHTDFTGTIYLLTQEESGSHIPLIENDQPEIHLWGIDVTAHLHLPSNLSIISPGEHAHVSITLELPLALEIGTRFEVKKMGACIGIGIVTSIL